MRAAFLEKGERPAAAGGGGRARSCPTTALCCPCRPNTGATEDLYPREVLLRLAQTCALTPSSFPALWPTGRPAGCPRDVMMQINTFYILEKKRASPLPHRDGEVLSVSPSLPPPPLTQS